MKKELFELVKKEFKQVGILFALGLIIFKIVFFNENLIVVFRNVLSLFWLFVLPGYFIMLYWAEKLDFVERLIIGTAVAAGIAGILSYYLGLFGLNIKYHAILLPPAIIAAGFIIATRKKELKISFVSLVCISLLKMLL
ncbi:hypothetical protein J4448_02960 [Candidatus Woesearchaeota archaeon]|nr:hypothetical protein [Candidatus Woesearchaeota archaeon]